MYQSQHTAASGLRILSGLDGFHAIFHIESSNGGIVTYQSFAIDDDLKLVMLNQRHAAGIFHLVRRNTEYLRKWLPWVDGVTAVADTSDFISRTIDQHEKGRGPQYLIEFQGISAGVIGFHPVDWPNRNAEIGYWLGEEFAGSGLMTKSVEQLLKIGFQELNLNKIEIRCAADNKSSRAVAERVGMVYEGILRQEEWLYDHFVDHAVYSMLQREFKTLTGNEDE